VQVNKCNPQFWTTAPLSHTWEKNAWEGSVLVYVSRSCYVRWWVTNHSNHYVATKSTNTEKENCTWLLATNGLAELETPICKGDCGEWWEELGVGLRLIKGL